MDPRTAGTWRCSSRASVRARHAPGTYARGPSLARGAWRTAWPKGRGGDRALLARLLRCGPWSTAKRAGALLSAEDLPVGAREALRCFARRGSARSLGNSLKRFADVRVDGIPMRLVRRIDGHRYARWQVISDCSEKQSRPGSSGRIRWRRTAGRRSKPSTCHPLATMMHLSIATSRLLGGMGHPPPCKGSRFAGAGRASGVRSAGAGDVAWVPVVSAPRGPFLFRPRGPRGPLGPELRGEVLGRHGEERPHEEEIRIPRRCDHDGQTTR